MSHTHCRVSGSHTPCCPQFTNTQTSGGREDGCADGDCEPADVPLGVGVSDADVDGAGVPDTDDDGAGVPDAEPLAVRDVEAVGDSDAPNDGDQDGVGAGLLDGGGVPVGLGDTGDRLADGLVDVDAVDDALGGADGVSEGLVEGEGAAVAVCVGGAYATSSTLEAELDGWATTLAPTDRLTLAGAVTVTFMTYCAGNTSSQWANTRAAPAGDTTTLAAIMRRTAMGVEVGVGVRMGQQLKAGHHSHTGPGHSWGKSVPCGTTGGHTRGRWTQHRAGVADNSQQRLQTTTNPNPPPLARAQSLRTRLEALHTAGEINGREKPCRYAAKHLRPGYCGGHNCPTRTQHGTQHGTETTTRAFHGLPQLQRAVERSRRWTTPSKIHAG